MAQFVAQCDLPQADDRMGLIATVSWPTEPVDPFFNANTVEDLAEAERLASLVTD